MSINQQIFIHVLICFYMQIVCLPPRPLFFASKLWRQHTAAYTAQKTKQHWLLINALSSTDSWPEDWCFTRAFLIVIYVVMLTTLEIIQKNLCPSYYEDAYHISVYFCLLPFSQHFLFFVFFSFLFSPSFFQACTMSGDNQPVLRQHWPCYGSCHQRQWQWATEHVQWRRHHFPYGQQCVCILASSKHFTHSCTR